MRIAAFLIGVLFTAFCGYAFSNVEIDVSKYDDIEGHSARDAMIGVDYANIGNFKKASEYLEKALELAKRENSPEVYLNDIKIKLATAYINSGKITEGRALLKEVHKMDMP